MPLSLEQMFQKLQLSSTTLSCPSSSPPIPQSIKRTLQNFQIPASLPTSLRSCAKSPQISIRCPLRQGTTQHYGYRIEQNYLLYIESILKADPTVDRDDFYNPLSFTRRWIMEELQLHDMQISYCIDPERHPIVPLDPMYDTGNASDDDEDDDEDDGEFLLGVLSVCTDDPDSFRVRPTQAQLDLLNSLIGSQPQWWVGYGCWC
ncbi:putative protein 64 [Rhizopogon vesiculosus]|uniref:Uncharacterized protein n=1 Tax=Rhizopogon vesiculosus TaxID=180088 RepID=A0A1J8RDJ5_9AGAM|nr:putative protein 64 [Rhizopogon vesiculosus]